MATAYHVPHADSGPSPNVHVSVYPRGLPISELDFKDNRYPTSLTTPKAHNSSLRASTLQTRSSDRIPWETTGSPVAATDDWGQRRGNNAAYNGSGWTLNERTEANRRDLDRLSFRDEIPVNGRPSPLPERMGTPQSYVGTAQQSGQYGSEGNALHLTQTNRTLQQSGMNFSSSQQDPAQHQQRPDLNRNETAAYNSTPPRHRMSVGMDAGPSNHQSNTNLPMDPLPSSSLEPSRAIPIPISTNPRASAQYPTYITPATTPNPVNPIYSQAPPKEEVCVECAMRDQDMADVDVTSPRIWGRESDVYYEELLQRELEDEAAGIVTVDPQNAPRPRARGGRLSEQNLKIWLSLNPREPAARQQTLELYIKSQRLLLEAEALAHARAMHESQQLDNRMRDAYSQLRRSAYDTGSSAAPVDDVGGVRIKAPRSASSPSHNPNTHVHSHSREVTLLENGMIVEHVDVRKEEREEREKRRKEERRERSRARKSSRASGMDVMSIYSTQSLAPHTDSGVGLKSSSRYSQSSSVRPTSLLAAPLDRPPMIPRAYSQASFSDVHSVNSASPRRSRFFGFKNLSTGWRSQDSLAMSGSMVDMHVALQREANHNVISPVASPLTRHSQIWSPIEPESAEPALEEKPKKKSSGFAKIWRMVKGGGKGDSNPKKGEPIGQNEKPEDDFPLAPPPPLSYLVDRRSGDHLSPNGRHASTPSLPSISSPKNALSSSGMSMSTAPSSVLPSPTSSRPSATDRDAGSDGRKYNGNPEFEQEHLDPLAEEGARLPSPRNSPRNVHSVISEPDMRGRMAQSPTSLTIPRDLPRPQSTIISRDKSLPPLPGEAHLRTPTGHADQRPRTVFSYDPQSHNDLQPPRAPFRSSETRRQSFGGMASPPNIRAQTMPINGGGFEQFRLSGRKYDEFGSSRRSLGPIEITQEVPPVSTSPTPTKRRSKFGFASLLGRKSHVYENNTTNTSHEFPSRKSGSDGKHEATSASRHSIGPRGSRKPIHDLVEQDSDFVAYRYPSNDHQLDLLR